MAILRRYPLGGALGLVLGTLSVQAMAEPPAAAASNNGLMSFPNVRVETAPLPAKPTKAPAAAAARKPSMRAYVNSAGELVESAAADGAQLAANVSANRTRTGTVATRSTSAGAELETIYGPDNTVSVVLDEESMVFQMAHQDADGKLSQECVTGATHATQAVQSPAASRARTNHNHKQEGSHNAR